MEVSCHIKNAVDKNNATLIGHTRLKKPIYCPNNAKHIFISGTTGAGKGVLLSNFIKNAVKNNIGLLIIDGKGDTDKGSLLQITKMMCEKYNRPLYIVNMNDPENSARFNPLRSATQTVAKDMLINMSEWTEQHYKMNTERYIQRVIKTMNIAQIQLSFNSVIEYMSPDNFEMLSARLQKEGLIPKEEHIKNLELIKTSADIAKQAEARFATIAESEIGQIFSADGLDIYTALESGAVVLFVLNPMLMPETSAGLGKMVIISIKQAISQMFGSEKRTFIILDELNAYASPALVNLYNKSRSAGVTCIGAVQSMSDLDNAAGIAFRNQILENSNNYVIMRQNAPDDAELCAKILGTTEKMQLTYQISQLKETELGTAKRVREFIIHPDEIKSFDVGEGVFLSRDTGKCDKIKIYKPF